MSLKGECYSDVQLAYVPDQTSVQIDPVYSQGPNSFELGNGGNTYLTISLTDPQPGQLDSLKAYLFEGAASFPVTGDQLKKIFPSTAQDRCDEVAAAINRYSDKFGINTLRRMSYFLGQIGVETQGLEKLNESPCYRKSTIKIIFGKAKYCDLFVGYDSPDDSKCPLPACRPDLKAYSDALQVKDKYICSASLFDYVYGCRLGNGAPSTKDGSIFKGHCFIHLTGLGTYEVISKEWNKDRENAANQKDFTKIKADGGHFEELETDVDVAMKAALYYWNWKTYKGQKANYYADNEDIDNLTFLVNGGDNGLKDKKSYTSKAKEILK